MSEPKEVVENAATRTLQRYFSSLVEGLQDPDVVATRLYSVNVVPWSILERVTSTIGLSRFSKSAELMSAVRRHIITNPSSIDTFIQVLQDKSNLQEIAYSMKETYQGKLNNCLRPSPRSLRNLGIRTGPEAVAYVIEAESEVAKSRRDRWTRPLTSLEYTVKGLSRRHRRRREGMQRT